MAQQGGGNAISNVFQAAPEPETELGRLRLLSPTCALRVSPLALGGMSFGQAWNGIMGEMSYDATMELLDAFYDAGGNFIDTSNNYQFGESETWIGDWMEKKGVRDEMVIATKFTTGYREDAKKKANYQGNSYKSMVLSVEASLKKLKTTYIDILYIHWWDYTTSVEEVMQGLNRLVEQGKVLYLGISDTPAWIVARANEYARAHGLAQFVIYQGRWNLMLRDMEKEIIPMARAFGMALAPWQAVGGGKFQSRADVEARGGKLRPMRGSGQTEDEVRISEALEKVGKELGTTSVTAVALAWITQKTPYCFPIVGGRKVSHLHDNITSLSLALSDEHVAYLESISPLVQDFPSNFIGTDPHTNGGVVNNLLAASGKLRFVQAETAIKPLPK